MSKNTKGILTVVGIAAMVLVAWNLTHRNKKAYARNIIKLGGATGYATLLTFGDGFLQAWSKGLSKGKQDFSYQGETYRTQGGKKITDPQHLAI
jgi:hypothetical protein